MMFLTLCASGLVAGESTLLLVSYNAATSSPWSTTRNLVLACSDVLLGGVLAFVALAGTFTSLGWLYDTTAAVLILTHLYREGEYITGRREPFARSLPLFVINNVRLVLLGWAFGLALSA